MDDGLGTGCIQVPSERKEGEVLGGVAGRLSDWALGGREVSGVIPSPLWTLSNTHLSLTVECFKVFTN